MATTAKASPTILPPHEGPPHPRRAFSFPEPERNRLVAPAGDRAGMLESMRSRVEPLLCELHAHTTWSDGELTVRELVDLYGRRGFDVLAVTDHVCRSDDPLYPEPHGVRPEVFGPYICEIGREVERALRRYGLLVLPGLELTYNDASPQLAAHAVAVGLRSHVAVDDGIEDALGSAREAGAATIAAHPHRPG